MNILTEEQKNVKKNQNQNLNQKGDSNSLC